MDTIYYTSKVVEWAKPLLNDVTFIVIVIGLGVLLFLIAYFLLVWIPDWAENFVDKDHNEW